MEWASHGLQGYGTLGYLTPETEELDSGARLTEEAARALNLWACWVTALQICTGCSAMQQLPDVSALEEEQAR
eukprot:1570538-Rhodomonas_salina.1